jgi:hypothetical protein
MDSILLKFASLIEQGCVARLNLTAHRIPVIRVRENVFLFFLLEPKSQSAINLNQQLYDFFTKFDIWPSLIGGYFMVERLSLLLELVDG